MSKRKGTEHIVYLKKFLNHNSDCLKRLKSLRNELDKVPVTEAKQIINEYSSSVFYVLYTSFTSVETTLNDRVQKGRNMQDQIKEMKEVILPSLERIVILLPELIHQKWQYNSICLIVRKLLHPHNISELQQYGIKILVLWLQALQENAGDAVIELFASAIPHFPPKKTPLGLPDDKPTYQPDHVPYSSLSLCERYGIYSSDNSSHISGQLLMSKSKEWVTTSIIKPISTVSSSADTTLQLMEYLLTCLTSQVGRLKWTDPSNHYKGFSFLFFQFKLFYLVCLYRNFRSDAGLYAQTPPPQIKVPSGDADTVNIILPSPEMGTVSTMEKVLSKRPKHISSVSAAIKLDYDTSDPVYITVRHLILKFVLKWIMPGFHSNHPGSVDPKVAVPSPCLLLGEHSFVPDSVEIMRDMWTASRDNINLLFEICHQGFKLPLSHVGVVNKLTELYLSWVHSTSKPLFMQQPPDTTQSLPSGMSSVIQLEMPSVVPWEVISGYNRFDRSDVRAGIQPSLRMFISHTSELFLHQAPSLMVENQVESGKRIIKLYQEIMSQWSLDPSGWQYLLSTLLYLCLELMKESSIMGESLADVLLQTLFEGYVKASMVVELPGQLWNNLVDVLSHLTPWKQVIVQWTEIMKSLTQCLSRVVYQLDLDDLPLQQNKQHFRPRTHTTASDSSEWKNKKYFIDIKPPLKRGPVSTSVIKSGLFKANTLDEPSSTQSTPLTNVRRQSSPAYSSIPVTRKEITANELKSHYKSHDESHDESHDNEFSDVITNIHILPDKISQTEDLTSSVQQVVSRGSELVNSSLIISNDDVTSYKSEDTEDDITYSTIKRSASEHITITRLNEEDVSSVYRPLSPNFTRTVENESSNHKKEFIPKPLLEVTPPVNTSPKQEFNLSGLPSTIYEDKEKIELSSERSHPFNEGYWNYVNTPKVWYRILCAVGDINNIMDPDIHALAMRCMMDTWRQLQEIESNLGITLDNETTPMLPPYLPPTMIFLPWVVKACSLPVEYLEGRKIAYHLLCEIMLRHVTCATPPHDYYLHFYRLMRDGLQPSSDVLFTAIKRGSRILSFGLEGVFVLYQDILQACNHVLSSKHHEAPRVESLTLLGDMFYLLSDTHPLKMDLIKTIFTSAIKEPYKHSRCQAIYEVGMICLSELSSGHSPSSIINEAFDILLATLKFNDSTIVLSSVDMLSLLAEKIHEVENTYPEIPCRLLQSITSAAANLLLTPDNDKKTKMLISVLLCLRDWTLSLTIEIPQTTLNDLFQVLYATVSGSECRVTSPIELTLAPLETSPRSRASTKRSSRRIDMSASIVRDTTEEIITVARSILHHLLNLIGHFPFPCGAAQMSSVVCEYHDCPSLQYLDELSPEIFDSPRVQFFSLNNEAVITFVEIPVKDDGIPIDVSVPNYQCRVIIRDITGRYCWDSAVLFGQTTHESDDPASTHISLLKAESIESIFSESEHSSSSLNPDELTLHSPLLPPSWQRDMGSSDLLHKLLTHVESSSPECILYSGMGLVEPAPSINEPTHIIENGLQTLIEQQHKSEYQYLLDTSDLHCMRCVPVLPPQHCQTTFAFHYCHLFLSHMGFLSWNKRNCFQLLGKNEQLIRELKHLDGTQTQCRQTYKVAVLYVACGQEDKRSILQNSQGSRAFEEFVSGLGWEVDMTAHVGYMGGLKQSYCDGYTMPYYATSSEEILFHVSTRMPSTGSDIEQKVRHLGNDEVHIIWSEHWRDYRRNIFKTQFADILIIIYPLPNKLYRIEINKRNNVFFGPLFDGAIVDGLDLPILVRNTAINALRTQRSPLFSYRGRYQERWRYIQGVVNMNVKSSFEDFAQSVMHPLEFGERQSPIKRFITHPIITTSTTSTGVSTSSSSLDGLPHLSSSNPESRWIVPTLIEHKHIGISQYTTDIVDIVRPRSHTTDDSIQHSTAGERDMAFQNHSVPDNLCDIGVTRKSPWKTDIK